MQYGKRSIYQLLGTMAVATSISVGTLAVPALNQPMANAYPSDVLSTAVGHSGQIYGDYDPRSGNAAFGNYTADLEDGTWFYNATYRTVTADITDAQGNKKYWASAGDTITWTLTYVVDKDTDQANETDANKPVFYFALPVIGSDTGDNSEVTSVTYTTADGISTPVDTAVTTPNSTNETGASPFKSDGSKNTDNMNNLGAMDSVHWVSVPTASNDSSRVRWLTGDKITITVQQKATGTVDFSDTALSASDVQIDKNARLFADIYEGYRQAESNINVAGDGSNKLISWNRTGWNGFFSVNQPFLQVARASVSVVNNLGFDVTYKVGDTTRTVASNASSSAVGAPYGTYTASTTYRGFTIDSNNSVTLGEDGVDSVSTTSDRDALGPNAILTLTPETSFPALSTYKSQLDEILDLPSTQVNDTRKADYIKQLQAAKSVEEADAIVADAKLTPADRINSLTNLTPAQKADYLSQLDATGADGFAIANAAASVDAAMAANPTATQNAVAATDADKAAAKAVASELGLTGDAETAFDGVIDSASTDGDIATALKNAFKDAFEDANRFPNLTPAQLDSYKAAIDALDPSTASVADYKKIFDSAKAVSDAMADNAAENTNTASAEDKAAALAELKALGVAETDPTYQKLADTNSSMTVSEVAQAVKDAASNTRSSVKDQIDALPYLTEAQKTEYKKQVDAAAGTGASTILSAAQSVNSAMGASDPLSNTTVATAGSKTAADSAITALGVTLDPNDSSYTPDEQAAIRAFQNATTDNLSGLTDGQIAEVLRLAQEKKIDELPNLSDTQKDSYKKQLNGTSDSGTATVPNATDAAAIIAAATAVNNAAGGDSASQSTSPEESSKTAAQAAVDALGLTGDAATKAASDIAAAGTNQALLDAIKDAQKAKIDSLDGLTQAQKDSYKKALDNANGQDAANLVDEATKVNNVTKDATAEGSADEATADDIAAAQAEVSALDVDTSKLSDTEKAAYDAAVATLAKTDPRPSTAELAQALKDIQKAKIDSLDGLTAEQKASYQEQLKDATGSAAEAIIDAATKAAAALTDPTATTNTDATTAADREAAKSATDALTNGISDIDPALQARIDKAQNADATYADLADAVRAAQEAKINSLSNLTPEQKQDYINALANTTGEQAKAILDNAALVDAAAGNTATDEQKNTPANATDIQGAKDAIAALPQVDENTLSPEAKQAYDEAMAKLNGDNPTVGDVAAAVAAAQNAVKDSAVNAINNLTNLTPAQKADYLRAVSEATPAEANAIAKTAKNVDGVMGTATDSTASSHPSTEDAAYNAATDAATQADIDAAKAAINGMTALPQATKDFYLNTALAGDNLSQANVADSLKRAIAAWNETYDTQVDSLTNLTPEQKQAYKDAIAAAPSDEAKQAIVDAAKAMDTAMASENPETANTNAATDADKDGAQKALAALADQLKAAGVDTTQQPYSYVNDDNPTVGQLAEAVKAAKDAAKQAAKQAIDALDNLTPEQKQSYKDQIDTADATAADDIVTGATNVNTGMDPQADTSAIASKPVTSQDTAAAQAALDAITNIPSLIDDFKAQANSATDPATLAKVVLDALNASKEAAKQAIDALNNLTPAQKQSYKDDIDAAKGAAQINSIVDGATQVDTGMGATDPTSVTTPATSNDIAAAKKALEDLGFTESDDYYTQLNADNLTAGQVADIVLKATRNASVAALNKLTNLTDEQRESYKQQIESADSNTANSILGTATNVDAVMGGNPSQDQSTAAANPKSTQDVTAATAAINAMTNLDDATKQQFIDELGTDTTQADVAATVLKALDAAKEAAKQAIDALTNLTPEQKQSYKDSIDAAKGAEAINKIVETATNVDAIMGGNPSTEQSASAINPKTDADVAAATAAINALSNLDDATKQRYLDELGTDSSQAQVADTVMHALSASKDAAKAAIEALDNLTPEQKQSYKDAVDAANGADAINKIVETATNVDAVMSGNPSTDQSTAAEAAKITADVDAATAAINAMTNLDDAAKQQYLDELGTDASQADVANTVMKALNSSKDAAKAAIDSMENLTPEQKDSYKNAIDAATNPETVTNTLTSAGNIDAVMGGEAGDKATAANTAAPSDQDKAAAKDAINALSNLSDEEKQSFLDRVDNAGNQADVAKAVMDALNASKTAAKNAIDAMKNLTDDEKTQAKDAIDAAATIAAITSVVTTNDTTNTNRFNSALDQAKQALAQAQTEYENVRYTNASAEVKKAFEDNIARLQNLIASAEAVDGATDVSAADLYAYASDLGTSEEALDGVEAKKFNWMPIILLAGGLGVAGAAWYYFNNVAPATAAANGAAGAAGAGAAGAGATANGAGSTAAGSSNGVIAGDQNNQANGAQSGQANGTATTGAAGQDAQASASRGVLAMTGANVSELGLLALALLAVGGVFAARRRKES
ncbi:MAG: LPXTG cell wall anchor domain-containing protein [Corynebacterium sp.]|nr:LPXTG cell wall anchor domain-containing protein [Corynebacterium sp.]